ncbi:hypothetical protein LTS09_016966 [Friedmanniomyces endolithicus]|nr:hypothetical protein LTS09_016966 [Friedmanniomyces endolithicus]
MVAVANVANAALAARAETFTYGGPYTNNAWSPLGTPQHQPLPYYRTDNPMPQGRPWGGRDSWNTNYYTDTPNTGVTRYYDWNITKLQCSPDGVETTCLAVNGQVPGELVTANWGEWIQVNVCNAIPDEGTAIHWHGLLQKQTPYMDGVPGMTQCPIAPGTCFTYRFQADLYGTTWYHSHYGSQYASGLVGPLVIYGPNNTAYGEDLGPVMISDWYHEYYETVVDALLQPLPAVNIPMSDNNLINGKNSFNGNGAPMASFNFTRGKTYRLRLINPSAAAVQKFSIDGHTMTVIANDFVEIEPYETDHVTLAVGQRSDVLVKATGNATDAVWMRGYKPPPCWPTHGGDEVKAAIFYENADRTQAPTTSAGPNAYDQYCGNDPLSQTVPTYAINPGEPSVIEIIPIEFRPNGTNLLWYLANRTFRADYNDPILLEAKQGSLDFPYIENVHNYGEPCLLFCSSWSPPTLLISPPGTNRSIRFVFENTGAQPHPMHLHGHNIFVLQEGSCVDDETVVGGNNGSSVPGHTNATLVKMWDTGYGSCWDGSITNAGNPQRRDVQMLLPGHYIVVQWNQDNPGVWPFHCHIAWHLSAGFVWTVLEQPDFVENEMEIPQIMAQTCTDWSAWTSRNVVNQIDDGV